MSDVTGPGRLLYGSAWWPGDDPGYYGEEDVVLDVERSGGEVAVTIRHLDGDDRGTVYLSNAMADELARALNDARKEER